MRSFTQTYKPSSLQFERTALSCAILLALTPTSYTWAQAIPATQQMQVNSMDLEAPLIKITEQAGLQRSQKTPQSEQQIQPSAKPAQEMLQPVQQKPTTPTLKPTPQSEQQIQPFAKPIPEMLLTTQQKTTTETLKPAPQMQLPQLKLDPSAQQKLDQLIAAGVFSKPTSAMPAPDESMTRAQFASVLKK